MEKKSDTLKNSINNLSDTSETERGSTIYHDNFQAKNSGDKDDLRVLYTNLEKRIERLEKGLKLINGIVQP